MSQKSNLKDELQEIRFVKERAKRYVSELSPVLNNLHGIKESEEYWSLLIDSWLIHFISVIVDRVENCEVPLVHITEVPQLKTLLNSFDMNVFSREKEFNYNLQLCLSRIKASTFHWQDSISSVILQEQERSISSTLSSLFISLFRPKVLLVDSYFSHKDSFLLMIKSGARIVSIPSKLLFTQRPACIDIDKRAFLSINEKDDLDMFMNHLLPVLFPQNLLELYQCNKNEVLKYTSSVKSIGSAICIHSSDHYKILAAEIRKRSGRVIGFQHGGNYNVQKEMLAEYIEVKNSDEYVFWNDARGFGATKLNRLKKRPSLDLDFQRILLISTSVSKWHYRAQTTIHSGSMKEYFKSQHDLYGHLDKKVKQQFFVRPYPQDYGWNYKSNWVECFGGDVNFDEFSSLEDSLNNTSLLIVDHISTTWIEALYLNIPIIFSFRVDRYLFKDEIKEVLLKLKGIGVLFEYPEQVSAVLNAGLIEYCKLWMSEDVQAVVNEIKSLVYKLDEQYMEHLTNFLLDED